MRCGSRGRVRGLSGLAAALLALCGVCLVLHSAQAAPAEKQSVKVLARFSPQVGMIADAAMADDGHLFLLYPELGQIADYTLDGKLYQHIVRESGAQSRFRPTACTLAGDKVLLFDEADHKVFYMNPDGNISRGIDLAYPAAEGALALSRIGDLTYGTDRLIYALLPERGVLASFDGEGQHVGDLDLATLLPYPQALYTRAQLLADGSLFVLDYLQGAVMYRHGAAGEFHRLRLGEQDATVAAPQVQDFAAAESGNLLVATYSESAPLVLLDFTGGNYHSHTLEIKLPVGGTRLACRASRGKYIVWSRDRPFVMVLQAY